MKALAIALWVTALQSAPALAQYSNNSPVRTIDEYYGDSYGDEPDMDDGPDWAEDEAGGRFLPAGMRRPGYNPGNTQPTQDNPNTTPPAFSTRPVGESKFHFKIVEGQFFDKHKPRGRGQKVTN